jgi:hypothetical protein
MSGLLADVVPVKIARTTENFDKTEEIFAK